jgi:sulfite dehydrogenase (cytochrome) subunit A
VATPLSLSVADLKAMPAVEIVAVNQCSGNSRGFFEPRVAGGQLANGAMGNARWRGVTLKAVLEKAGVQAGAKQVTFNGLDGPVLPTTPDFVKALDLDRAMDGEVMIAYEMNGTDLPMLNGYPVRLIVPGWFGTYWVKHLSEVTVVDNVYDGFWMKTAYRIPDNTCACVEPGAAPKTTVPINRFSIRSFITNVRDGANVQAGREFELRGIAFDSGYGIREVSVSIDDGGTWTAAALDSDLGKYSFRGWKTRVWLRPGNHVLKVRAVNAIGQTQPSQPLWNPAGYMRNVVETTRVTAA